MVMMKIGEKISAHINTLKEKGLAEKMREELQSVEFHWTKMIEI
jgi:hypothetical protein